MCKFSFGSLFSNRAAAYAAALRALAASLFLFTACAGDGQFDAAPSATDEVWESESYDSAGQALVAVPAKIEAEAFDRAQETTTGNSGAAQCTNPLNPNVDIQLTTDVGGGCNIGWFAASEWLEYDISVAATANFDITLRVANGSTATQTFHLELDGVSLGLRTIPPGGWQSWQDRSYTNVRITAGATRRLRLVADSGNINVNYLRLAAVANGTCSDGVQNGDETGIDCGGRCPACSSGSLRREAESYSAQRGTSLANGNTTVGSFDAMPGGDANTPDYLAYEQVDLTGLVNLRVRFAKGNSGGLLELRVDAVNGPLLANFAPANTGGWAIWQERNIPFTPISGTHTLYLVAAGRANGVMNFDWLELNAGASLPAFRNPSRALTTRVSDLLGRLTLAQKIGQMTQGEQTRTSLADVTALRLGSILSGGSSEPAAGRSATAWADLVDSFQRAALAATIQGEPGIPLLYGIDAIHGHAKVLGATVFPHNIGLGATRNAALMREFGAVAAKEIYATGIPWAFAPTVCVARDQRWGRTYECGGETAELGTLMAEQIAGLQGAGLGTANTVMASAKHYVGDGGAVYGTGTTTPIDRGNARMGEAALRAIHLSPYLRAVALGAGTIMPSFSSVGSTDPGTKMHGSNYWLNTVLKGELDFSGFLISDWQAIHVAQLGADLATQAQNSVNAGVDMFMEPAEYGAFITGLSSKVPGSVSVERINEAVRRILTRKFQLGLFEKPFANRAEQGAIGSAAHRAVARQAVRESLVLLKNNAKNGENTPFLPLSTVDTVCINGSGADNLVPQAGGWTLGWAVPEATPQGTSIRAAIANVIGAAKIVSTGCAVGIRVVSEVVGGSTTYAEGGGDEPTPHHDNSGSCVGTKGCVVILLGGRPVDIDAIVGSGNTKAIVMAWYPGTEGGGIADVLYRVQGANFSGKLPVTWKRDDYDAPINFCTSGGADCGDVGLHYSDPANPGSHVRYPYGYGLRYP